jgi:hypothetical protein
MPRSDGPKALPPEGRGTPRSIAPRLLDSCGKPRSTPGARGTQRLRPRVTSATSTTAATVEPTSTRRCAEATTPGVGDATTTRRIGAPRPNHPVCKLSAGPYDGRRSRPGSEPRLPSPSTRGRQGRNCGSRTTGWPASWVERTMTTSSSATFPYSSPTPPEPGWSICLLRRSPTGTTWSKPLPATSRAHTCALGTPGISEAAARSRSCYQTRRFWPGFCATRFGKKPPHARSAGSGRHMASDRSLSTSLGYSPKHGPPPRTQCAAAVVFADTADLHPRTPPSRPSVPLRRVSFPSFLGFAHPRRRRIPVAKEPLPAVFVFAGTGSLLHYSLLSFTAAASDVP